MSKALVSTPKRAMPKGRQFQKGVSGNPGGRSKDHLEAVKLARQHTKAAINALADIVQKSESDTARATAAIALLDRGWGKPVQPIDGDGEGGPVPVAVMVRLVAPGADV